MAHTPAKFDLPGATDDVVKEPRSYTDAFLAPVLAKAGKPKKRRADEAAE
jgi:excinuclease ABC subunit A